MEQGLDELRLSFPSNCDLKSVLLKASTVNALYATNVYAIRAIARHICEVFFAEKGPSDLGLVSRIAVLKVSSGKERRCVVFASKYAHFFVDPDRFCILDYYAGQALAAHLGAAPDWARDYPAFARDVERLRQRDRITVSNRELDHYLWLYGRWRDYVRGQLTRQQMGTVFERNEAEVEAAFGS